MTITSPQSYELRMIQSKLLIPEIDDTEKLANSYSSEKSKERQNLLKHYWTKEEDDQLKSLVLQYGAKNWKKIASYFELRSDVQCLHRWQKVLNPALIKGPWTREEDDLLGKMVIQYGPKHWSLIASALPGRIGKQCRERYINK